MVREVSLEELREFGDSVAVRKRRRACADCDEEVFICYLRRHHDKVVPRFGRTELTTETIVFGVEDSADKRLNFIGTAEDYPASKLAGKTRKTTHPSAETGFVLRFRRNEDEDSADGVERDEAARDYEHFVCRFQKMFDFGAEERVDKRCSAVESEDNFGDVAFLNSVEDTGNGVEVISLERLDSDIGGRSDADSGVKRTVTELTSRGGVVVSDVEGVDVVTSAVISHQDSEFDKRGRRLVVGNGNEGVVDT